MKNLRVIALVLLAMGKGFGQQSADLPGNTANEYGFSLGLLAGGEVYIAEFDRYFGLDSGLSLFGFYDFFITDKFAVGGNAHVAFPGQEFLGETLGFYELALALKIKLSLGNKFSYKPGFNIGYRLITSDNLDTIQGLGLNLTNELQLDVSERFTPFVDLGFISQPAGGNDEFNTTFSPIIVFRVGVSFN